MKITLKSMLPYKHIAITAAAVVSFTQAAQAVINLDFVYDSVTNTTTASYSGTWDVASDFPSSSGTLTNLDTGAFFSIAGNYNLAQGGISTAPAQPTYPWTYMSATSRSGDAFGFTTTHVFGPDPFDETTSITGSLVFAGSSLIDLRFANTNGGDSGTLTGPGGSVNWSTAVVPEPASAALLFGLFMLGITGLRRRL